MDKYELFHCRICGNPVIYLNDDGSTNYPCNICGEIHQAGGPDRNIEEDDPRIPDFLVGPARIIFMMDKYFRGD